MNNDKDLEIKNFIPIKILGSGTFGEVYICSHRATKKTYALKVEKKENSKTLSREYKVYKAMNPKQTKHISKLYAHGYLELNEKKVFGIVLDLFGSSLKQISDYMTYFSEKSIYMLALLILEAIEEVHRKNIIHRDIKPANFVFSKDGKNIVLIDFGLAISISKKKGEHKSNFVGTLKYAPLAAHVGTSQTYKDDIESIGYCLLYLLKKKLPWTSLKITPPEAKRKEINRLKTETTVFELTEGNQVFQKFFIYVRDLNWGERPNYEYLRSLFIRGIRQLNAECDFKFEWSLSDIQKL